MKVECQRKFLPVGHGAFFIERLLVDGDRVCTIVYDCGDSYSGKQVEHYSSQEFGPKESPNEKIDILFISHFDSDHINGIKYLQPYMSHRIKVFMPFYYDSIKSVYDKKKQVGIAQVINVLDTKQIKPVFVQHQGANEEQPDEIDLDEFDFERSGYVIRSGQPISKKVCGYSIWRYIPFNLFNERKFFQDFKIKVKKIGWTKKELDDPQSWDDNDIKQLRKVYQSFPTSINDNSLIVLSCCPKKAIKIKRKRLSAQYLHKGYYIPNYRYYRLCFSFFYTSCLYVGDTVLKRNVKKSKYVDCYEDLLKELNRFTKRVSLMQVPHHGSSNNNNIATLCDCMSYCLFCNFDTKDKGNNTFFLKSTNVETLWKNIINVTEQEDTVFEEWYSYIIV